MHDAVVVGAGPNGLVASNLLVDAGWDVLLLEEQEAPGGAVKSGEITLPGFTSDLFSAFYPLAAASPVIRALELERHGLKWARAPLAVAHPLPDGACAVLSPDIDETAESLDSFAPGDGAAWRDMYGMWQAAGSRLIDALLRPFPPIGAGAGLAVALGFQGLARLARTGLVPLRRFAEEEFLGEGGGLLLGGNALHGDLTPEVPGSALFGWLLTCLGQEHGFPVPEGGAGRLTDALVARFESRGGEIRCGAGVTEIVVRSGRAFGVKDDHGDQHLARRAVLADVGAPSLYLDLVGVEHLSNRFLDQIRRFQYDHATVKVDWALNGPIPWKADAARRAGTLHISESMDHLSEVTNLVTRGVIPERPFLVMGQMNVADPTRSPEGTETAWAYTHVPQTTKGDAGGALKGSWDDSESQIFAERIENEVEALAPGFKDLVLGRHVFSPSDLQRANANLVNGAFNGGTAQIHQQLVFRPTPGLAGPRTPIENLYLASASAHPGGGVHGACGSNAALAALGGSRNKALLTLAAGLAATGVAARLRSR